MPELPEVETIRRSLLDHVTNKQIANVSVLAPRIIRCPTDIAQFCTQLTGTTISTIKRRGKFLQFICQPYMLLSHLRMEGNYYVAHHDHPLVKHTLVRFTFTDGSELRYRDTRRFGTMDLLPLTDADTLPPLANLGPEPLTDQFTFAWFTTALKRKGTIKSILLNQTIIAGLGNIYVDEVLYRARLHPQQPGDTISLIKLKQLFRAITDVIAIAINTGGSSVRSYVDSSGTAGSFQDHLQVYGKRGQSCPRCQTLIERIVVASRGTHLCHKCQRLT